MTAIFTVAVGLGTHDDVKAGKVCTRVSFCTVLADSDQEAKLVAAQLAATVHDMMPTSTEILEVTL